MRRLWIACALLAIVGAGAFWVLTEPRAEASVDLGDLSPDPERGALVFAAGGCAGCHSAPEAKGEARLVLSGGRALPSPFGTFFAPNISQDPEHGIGGWQLVDLVNAMRHGVSPDGRHYYPAFPYASYARANLADIADLYAYLRTLPADATPNRAHEVGFPFNIRRLLGGWKLLFLSPEPVTPEPADPVLARGRYLVESLGHCGECHTPRNVIGGPRLNAWLRGAPNPAGKGTIPDITPNKLDWSAGDIAIYLSTGFTPDFDTAGGEMAEVIENVSALPESDLAAIAAYLKALPVQ